MPYLDLLLALTLIWLAYHAVSRRDLFKSVVLFITYGVLLSLVWVRLRAYDLALVEVAIGAGLTGALFLNAVGDIEHHQQHRSDASPDDQVIEQGEG